VVTAHGRWYVVGHDLDRGEPRMFRMSRITTEVSTDGGAGSYTVPPGTDIRALSQSLAPPQPHRTAVVLARSEAAQGLRRRASVLAEGLEGPDGSAGWDRLEVPFGWLDDFVEELLGYADTVLVEEPREVLDQLVTRLTAAVEATA
jgi:proteasome accessory factor B